MVKEEDLPQFSLHPTVILVAPEQQSFLGSEVRGWALTASGRDEIAGERAHLQPERAVPHEA